MVVTITVGILGGILSHVCCNDNSGYTGRILSHVCCHEITVATLEGQWNHFRCPDITVGRHSWRDLESIYHELTVGILEEQWSHTCCHEMKVNNIRRLYIHYCCHKITEHSEDY